MCGIRVPGSGNTPAHTPEPTTTRKNTTMSTHPRLRESDILGYGQQGQRRYHNTLPDKYGQIAGRAVRYRVRLDTSNLASSRALIEMWDQHAGWSELVNLHLDAEFYVRHNGPATTPVNPDSRELSSRSMPDQLKPADIEQLCLSWEKVYRLLADEARCALGQIDTAAAATTARAGGDPAARAHQLAQLQRLHLAALRAADGGSNDDEIEALQDLAEAALGLLDDYTAPEL